MNSRAIFSTASLAACVCCVASAAEPQVELDAPTAVKLLNLHARGRMSQVSVAFILEGSGKVPPFEARHVRKVVAVHPVLEEGRMVRRMRVYDFHWSEDYGWFFWEMRQERGGDAVWIWSELKGEVVIR